MPSQAEKGQAFAAPDIGICGVEIQPLFDPCQGELRIGIHRSLKGLRRLLISSEMGQSLASAVPGLSVPPVNLQGLVEILHRLLAAAQLLESYALVPPGICERWIQRERVIEGQESPAEISGQEKTFPL